MPIIVHYINEHMRPDIIEGESWRQIDQDSPRMGTINLKTLDDGHRIIVNKSAVAKVEEFPEAAWQAMKDEQEKQAADQAKARSDAEADKKAKAAAATLALLEAKLFKNKLKRFLHIKKA